jgi:secondary thiamine-phosphate synthase enzyme
MLKRNADLNERSALSNARPTPKGPLLNENGSVIVHREFETKTGGRFDAVDITEDVRALVAGAGVATGTALVFSPHTTCCMLICPEAAQAAESLARTLEVVAPENGYYAHDDFDIRTENLVEDEPPNAPAHILHVVLGKASEAVPIVDGRLALADDQRIFFVELDSSRPRRYLIQVLGE